MPLPKSPDSEPARQGFVGYMHVEGLQWRVMVRLRLEDEAWWRGRLWFSEAGGTEVWDKEEIFGRSPEELRPKISSLSHTSVPPASENQRRPRHHASSSRRSRTMTRHCKPSTCM